MSQSLPVGGFEWIDSNTDYNVLDNSDFGYVLEVDLEYPDELHNLHSDFPLCPENICVDISGHGVGRANDTGTAGLIPYRRAQSWAEGNRDIRERDGLTVLARCRAVGHAVVCSCCSAWDLLRPLTRSYPICIQGLNSKSIPTAGSCGREHERWFRKQLLLLGHCWVAEDKGCSDSVSSGENVWMPGTVDVRCGS
ncbi:hypothetical protein HF086_015251 [Spodoptera exigua]|uniref:Uncharacterized protein n=1 Tax=Spodoptera exigua TaxID=7107 RepID=A0A922MG53_SPOEX|nr:hypothetical protein HF086_015251 [Spodoptera exigua]